eukprot:CAMPEP_0174851628 /NCGR_PEP_ID=MMETSP1114-20130205/23292_1 /TAXON_ID=312471 /ORGANISM="Neobodo designis, Strain CCAP 1951/1" /LENGTH=37 /DNA_ID= /DNA_START= /DNA_END= /DNA_ORIENTATION=
MQDHGRRMAWEVSTCDHASSSASSSSAASIAANAAST